MGLVHISKIEIVSINDVESVNDLTGFVKLKSGCNWEEIPCSKGSMQLSSESELTDDGELYTNVIVGDVPHIKQSVTVSQKKYTGLNVICRLIDVSNKQYLVGNKDLWITLKTRLNTTNHSVSITGGNKTHLAIIDIM